MLRVGFMQGRLSPKPEDRIQAFPRDSWREEFERGRELGFECVELIYDELHLEQNPLASDAGRRELTQLSRESGVALTSICADSFMIHPLERNVERALELLETAREIGCPLVEFPFVDSSSLRDRADRDRVAGAILKLAEHASKLKLRLAIETDLPPVEFRDFLARFPEHVGANLDLGNSAALGFDAMAECRAFGDRIFNVHIKDRVLGGTTVPLTTGHTDFERAFRALKLARYRGDFILQTAPDRDFLGAAKRYRGMTRDWMAAL